MSAQQPLIRHVSDTALWVAIHRANETERPDAQFRDPLARRLAGERGAQIAAAIAISEADSWSWMARTYLFDRFIEDQVRQGADLVVNLGAGLDARPYRMTWPNSLSWVEIDLPEIFDYKEHVLAGEQPNCRLERIRLDLADRTARRRVFESVARLGTKALIVTEGVVTYLSAAEVADLAADLAAVSIFDYWALDLASPGLLQMMQSRAHAQFSENATPLQFAPENGPDFFDPHGWHVVDVQSLLKTAGRLGRLPEPLRAFADLPEDPARMGQQFWSGVCLLRRTAKSH